jgi:hypothetical protein
MERTQSQAEKTASKAIASEPLSEGAPLDLHHHQVLQTITVYPVYTASPPVTSHLDHPRGRVPRVLLKAGNHYRYHLYG